MENFEGSISLEELMKRFQEIYALDTHMHLEYALHAKTQEERQKNLDLIRRTEEEKSILLQKILPEIESKPLE